MSRKLTISENLQQTMEERYYQPHENSPEQMIKRVVDYIAEGERRYYLSEKTINFLKNKWYTTIMERKWIPSSPFLMNAGTKVPMLSACFVVGGLEDDIHAIYEAVKRQGIINKMGGGTGFNFSKLREEGAEIKSTGGTSSGVMSFMELFNQNGEIIKQGGRRRSANIGVLRYDHPEIMKFIDYKTDMTKLNNFNISVLVDDIFMEKVKKKEDYELISSATGKTVRKVNAYEVFMKIMENNWKSAEPALLWVDNINKENPMREYLGDIVTTNPCGEITLYDDEACNLASINLEEFIDWNGNVDWDELNLVTRLVTRFLDTSIDVNLFPDEKIEKAVKNLRRLGIGIMGLHGALIKKGLRYSSEEGRAFAEELMKFINQSAWDMSKSLAEEKGVFPLWEHSRFAEMGIKVRNVACTTIAPTGTISQILDASSSGCEPIYALTYIRTITTKDGTKKNVPFINTFFKEFAQQKGFWNDNLPEKISNNNGSAIGINEIPKEYQELFETAMEITAKDHVLMQGALQKWVDNSIAKTINMPNEATVEEVAEAYMLGWEIGLKGMTIYRDGSRNEQVLSVRTDEHGDIKLDRGVIKTAPKISTSSKTIRLDTGCGAMYLTMTKDEEGNIDQTFIAKGSKGTCFAYQNAVSRLISLALRGGISVEDVIDQLLSVPVCPSYYGARCSGKYVDKGNSCPSAIAYQLKEYAKGNKKVNKKTITNDVNDSICPECGIEMEHEGGCITCKACGWSNCG